MLGEGQCAVDPLRLGGAEHRGHVAAEHVEHQRLLLRLGLAGQPLRQGRLRGGRRDRVVDAAAGADAGQFGEHGREQPLRGPCPQRGAVQPRRGQKCLLDGERRVEQRHRVRGAQGEHAVATEPLQCGGLEVSGHVAGLVPEPPGKGDRRQAGGTPMRGQPVQERVARCVVALPGRPHHPGQRGEQHEGSDIGAERQLVQVPCGVDLGAQHGVDALGGQGADHRVVEDAAGVDHCGQRSVDTRQQTCELLAVGNVGGHDAHACAHRLQVCHQPVGARRRRAAPRHQQKIANPVVGNHMPCHRRTGHTGAAGDQHGARRPRVGHRHDDLADLAGLAEVAQGRRRPADVERGHRKWLQHTGFEQRGELDEVFGHAGAAGLEEVEGAVGHPRMGRGHRIGIPDVGLAHLQEHPATRQQPQRRIHEIPGQRIQHHIHTTTTRGRQQPPLELQRPRITDVIIIETQRPQRLPLPPRRRRKHLQPPVPRQLHRGQPHPTGRGMNQHRLTRPHLRQLPQPIERGGEDDQYRRALGVGPARGQRRDEPLVGVHEGAGAVREESHHAVTDGKAGDAGAHLGDDAGRFAAEQRVVGEHPERDHDIAEVGGHSADLYANVAGRQRFSRQRHRLETQVVEGARLRDAQPPRTVNGRGQQSAVRGAGNHPGPMQHTAAEHDLRLAKGQQRRRVDIVGVGVQQHDPAGILCLRRAHQTPGSRPRHVRDVLARKGHRAAGHDDQRARRRVGQVRLQPVQHVVHRRMRLPDGIRYRCRRTDVEHLR